MTTFVLVPGMWLGAWAWSRVTDRLRAAGHRVYPLSLTGLAERRHLGSPATDLDTHVRDITALIEAEELDDVVLVGHSYAGAPVTGASDVVPERLRRVVYVDAGPLPNGMSQASSSGPEAYEQMRAELVDGWLVPPREWDKEADPVLLAGLSAGDLDQLRRRADPHPWGSVDQPAHWSDQAEQVPRTLIACALPLDQVRALMEQGHPWFAGLAGAQLLGLPTGHWPMFSEPAALADLLAEL
jgi:pimeloyl-ACP methyl ester carboxylesterase